jgi:UDP-MurNAc hydroxylase
MRVQLIGHAAVLVEAGSARVLSDPWFTGKAFNHSWAQLPPANVPPRLYDEVTHLFVSHEHPDHFHPPTLKAMPEAFKQRVTVLFQALHTPKMVDAFHKLGFPNVTSLHHKKAQEIAPGVTALLYQVGQMDSALVLEHEGVRVANLNDAPTSPADLAWLRRHAGKCHVVLNQFSFAGYAGDPDPSAVLPRKAAAVLDDVVAAHRALDADVTIPFASFVYFCTKDNFELNRWANTPADLVERFSPEGLRAVVLRPGDAWEVGAAWDNGPALAAYRADHDAIAKATPDVTPPVPLAKLREGWEALLVRLRELYPAWVLRRFAPVTVRVPDLDLTLRWSIADGTLEQVEAEPDLIADSQPLHFAFAWPFGFQTLGVSGRYRLVGGARNWQRHRVLFSLQNAELGLKTKHIVRGETLSWLWTRRRGAVDQLKHRLQRMRAGF